MVESGENGISYREHVRKCILAVEHYYIVGYFVDVNVLSRYEVDPGSS